MRKTFYLGGVIIAAFFGFTAVSIYPVTAAAVMRQAAAAFRCSTSGACVTAINTKTGSAIAATGTKGAALTANSSGGNGMVGSTTSQMASGVVGADNSNPPSQSNSGVLGTSSQGYGVQGTSNFGTGVQGTSNFGNAIQGRSNNGAGVEGASNYAYGVIGYTFGQSALGGYSAVLGEDESSTTGNVGVAGFSSQGTGLLAESEASTGEAIQSVAGPGVAVFVGTNRSNNQDVVFIDSAGNEILAGSLTQNGQLTIRTGTSNGKNVAAYSPRSSSPEIEDLGEGEMSNGIAYIKLDSNFASTMDRRAKYMVFITPDGDNRGLYVAQKSIRGFWVHEGNGGHSTLVFDYRIVAKPYDTDAPRLASTTPTAGLKHGRRMPIITLPQPSRHAVKLVR